MFIKCHPFQNVVADGVATVNFANLLGYTVEYVVLALSVGPAVGASFLKSHITDIDIKANAKTILKDTGTRTDDRMKYRGETADASYLVLAFDESRARTERRGDNVIDGEKVGAIDTMLGIASLTGEVTIAGALDPRLQAWAEVSAAPMPDGRFRSLISKTLNFTVSPAAAGSFPFDIPYARAQGAIIKRVFLFGATVTGYQVKRNGIIIQESDSAALTTYQQKREGRVPQANVQCIDFIKDGNQSSALTVYDANSSEWTMTVNGAGNVSVVVELYDPLNNN